MTSCFHHSRGRLTAFITVDLPLKCVTARNDTTTLLWIVIPTLQKYFNDPFYPSCRILYTSVACIDICVVHVYLYM